MGEAKRRGTYEERSKMAKLIKEQQEKSRPIQKPKVTKSSLVLASVMAMLGNV